MGTQQCVPTAGPLGQPPPDCAYGQITALALAHRL